MTRTCTKCKREKGADEFYNNAASPDGLTTRCDVCILQLTNAYNRSARGLALKKYRDMQKRCENADGKHPSYAHVRLQITREDFLKWAVPRIQDFLIANPGLRPSVDRINPDLGYYVENMRIISVDDNRARARFPGNLGRF